MKPNIRKYMDVFQYLRDFYSFRKSLSSKFSYQVWAEELGIRNKSYLRFVTIGRRPINDKILFALTQNLELSIEESEYFQILCQYNQSKSAVQKKILGKRLIGLLKNEMDVQQIEPHFEFLSNPLFPKLLTLLSFQDIQKTPENLGRLLMVSKEETSKALEFLIEQKMVQKKDAQYEALKSSFRVPDQFQSMGLTQFYSESFDAAKKAIHLPIDLRRFRALFVAMNSGEFQDFLEKFNEFAKEQLTQQNRDQLEDRLLYQVQFAAFPVSAIDP